MVPIAELLFLLVAIFVGARWYLRTPTHRARKNSAGCTTTATSPGTSRSPRHT